MHSSLLRKRLSERCCSISSDSSTPPLSTAWFEPPHLDLRVMTEEHRADVFQLVIHTFFRDEPLNRCLAFDIPTEPIEFTELVLSAALDDRCSFVAVDVHTQSIVAVILNIIKRRASDHDEQDQFDRRNFQSEKLRFILGVLKSLHRNVDLFEQMQSDRLLHMVIIAVDPHYRGLRLTEKLIGASLERAKHDCHVRGAFSEATSLYSAKAFRKQGFQVYDEIVYATYDHVRLASLAGEHDRCQLLAKQL